MLLPHRKMNVDRYRCSQDRIDQSLYECFPGGKLANHFGITEEMQLENLIEWIGEQNLKMIFKDGKIERDNILPFNKNNHFVPYKKMTIDELDEYLERVVRLIKERNVAKGMMDTPEKESL